MRLKFYINGQEINEPNNYQELSIQLNFDKDRDTAQVSVNEWELGVGTVGSNADGANLANNHITGTSGVIEGLPFRIDVSAKGQTLTLFDGYFDMWDAVIECDKIIAPAIERGKVDWLNDIADGEQ